MEQLTPKSIIDSVLNIWDHIDLDPCAEGLYSGESDISDNNLHIPIEWNVPAETHFTIVDDGLTKDWTHYQHIYCNPPYGREIDKWVDKCIETVKKSMLSEIILLTAARTDTKWFHKLRDFDVCFIQGRLKFSDAKNSAPFPSAVFYLEPTFYHMHIGRAKFEREFAKIGNVYMRV